ncbi:hypothetical protein [Enterococcus avium]|uniref:hypothetical protein n=1 Tax=Enterococcus avium TaxID=33945 RepID=UPI0032E37666
MTSKEALELLVRNMEVKEKNLEGIIEASQESLMKAVNDSSTRGKIMQESLVEQAIANIKYCRTQQGVYNEIKRWTEQALKEVAE